MVTLAINGFGRIGRNILRALYERPALKAQLKIVAVNDLGTPEINAHLTQFDTTHGRFKETVKVEGQSIWVGNDEILVFSERDPSKLPWGELGIDVVLECTGLFKTHEQASAHLAAGAKKVLLSAPGKNMDATIVYGVNHDTLRPEHRIVSNASCTTNCLAPVAKVLHELVGIEQGLMTTIHAYTNDQNLTDVYHADFYRARAAAHSMIPTKTGAAAAIGLVLPDLAGCLDGLAVRVPTLNVSLVDLSFHSSKDTSVEQINDAMRAAAEADTLGVLDYNDRPLVSVDFNHSPYSSTFDGNHTRVSSHLVKVLAWYDNEWGFSNRMLDNALLMATC
jgi:glyceraldehyde 3-phosphate dehydrogenase